jgi:hypothetical protein
LRDSDGVVQYLASGHRRWLKRNRAVRVLGSINESYDGFTDDDEFDDDGDNNILLIFGDGVELMLMFNGCWVNDRFLKDLEIDLVDWRRLAGDLSLDLTAYYNKLNTGDMIYRAFYLAAMYSHFDVPHWTFFDVASTAGRLNFRDYVEDSPAGEVVFQ